MMEIHFHGAAYAGSVEFAPDGVTVFTCPSDLDALPHMVAAELDPTPDQADAIADAWREWAALRRAAQRPNAQPDLLAFL